MGMDALTGLYNFKEFIQRSREAVIAHPEGQYALILHDSSNFKYINKFYGLEGGDRYIKEMAHFFRTHNTDAVSACRIDADQFGTFVELGGRTREEEIERIIRMNDEFEKKMNARYPDIFIHIYTGICFMERPDEDLRTIFDRAKMSKTRIKGRFDVKVQVYDPADYAFKDDIMEGSSRFRRASEEGRVVAFLQPKISASRDRLVGAEALARIVDQDGTVIPPGQFIPALEATGIIGTLDNIMVRRIFELQRRWLDEGRHIFPISVNISRVEFMKPDFVRNMIALQQEYDIPPEMIEFEILESMLALSSDLIVRTTSGLRDYGFRVSVDDFGSGYSSLNQIAMMPADVIKMDGIFARKTLHTEKGQIVVRTLIKLLHDIHYDIVFEGVETQEEKDLITSYGCDIIQGFYYSKPLPIEEFEERYFFRGIDI